MEEKLEAAQADQKNLFLIIFQVNSGSVWKLVPLLFPQLNLVHCEIEQLNQNWIWMKSEFSLSCSGIYITWMKYWEWNVHFCWSRGSSWSCPSTSSAAIPTARISTLSGTNGQWDVSSRFSWRYALICSIFLKQESLIDKSWLEIVLMISTTSKLRGTVRLWRHCSSLRILTAIFWTRSSSHPSSQSFTCL